MSRVAVFHTQNTFNYGSAMMGINFIYYMSEAADEQITFIVDMATDQDFERLQRATGGTLQLERMPKPIRSRRRNSLLAKGIRFLNRIKQDLSRITDLNVDCIVILGGDDLSEYYAGPLIVATLIRLYVLSRKVPVFLVGQTIGPFFSWRKTFARLCLRNCYVSCRDPASYRYVTEKLRLRHVIESSDLAFLDLPLQHNDGTMMILEKYELTDDSYVTVVPSGLWTHYSSSREAYIKCWHVIIEKLMMHPALLDKKIVLLPHVLRSPQVDDRNTITELAASFGNNRRLVFIYDEMLPSEARMILGHGFFTVTGRMHAAISTMQMGKPAISLSYSVKYDGIIGEGMGLRDLIVEAQEDKWSSGEIVEMVSERIEFVMKNYYELIKKIDASVKRNSELALLQIQHVANELMGEEI